jgi:hypothetical protein
MITDFITKSRLQCSAKGCNFREVPAKLDNVVLLDAAPSTPVRPTGWA